MADLKFFSMGSGSSGNCYYIGTNEYGFLIDAGVGIRNVKKYLKNYNIALENILGVFITHDHSDHIKSVSRLGERCHIPVYATMEMHEGINRNHYIDEKLSSCQRFFKKGEKLHIRDFEIQSFPVNHDATDCVGYSFVFHEKRFVLATDLGYINKEAADHIVRANYLVIESNYDENMLQTGRYPYPLKQRIRGHEGHLSNDHTAQFLGANALPKLSHLFLCHLSQDNNTPELALSTITNALAHPENLKVIQALERLQPSPIYILYSNT